MQRECVPHCLTLIQYELDGSDDNFSLYLDTFVLWVVVCDPLRSRFSCKFPWRMIHKIAIDALWLLIIHEGFFLVHVNPGLRIIVRFLINSFQIVVVGFDEDWIIGNGSVEPIIGNGFVDFYRSECEHFEELPD